jgi:MEMO1 family protein
MSKAQIVRDMQYAGSWYESDPDRLVLTIEEALKEAGERENRRKAAGSGAAVPRAGACIAMLPHAGLLFSARGIASLFVNLPVSVNEFIIISPSHYTHIPADTFTTAAVDAVRTPFGLIAAKPMHELLPGRVVHIDYRSIALEHALEMFLPFIAHYEMSARRSVTVGMCMVSHITALKAVELLSGALLEAVGDESVISGKTVIIASSDFTHYGRRFDYVPFEYLGSSEAQEQAVRKDDREYAQLFAQSRTGELLERAAERRPSICGFAPGLTASFTARQLGLTGEVFDQYTSNDVTGPSEDFVSYCSVLWR